MGCSLIYNYVKLLSFNHNYHRKKKKDDFATFLVKNLLDVTGTSLFHLKKEKYYGNMFKQKNL